MMVVDGQEVCKVGANGSQLQAGGGNHCLLEAFREREREREPEIRANPPVANASSHYESFATVVMMQQHFHLHKH